MSKVGFIGLGRMGRPMAGNMQSEGFPLVVYDVVDAPMRELAELGAEPALPSHAEVEAVVLGEGGVMANAAPGSLIMDMSTVDPASTDRVAAALQEAGMRFVDAPIGRLASHADRGECLFMVGAGEDDFAQVRPMLEAMGTDIHHCGGPGSGIRTKLVNNYLAITSCQMNAEALALTRRFGLDLHKTLDVIHGTTATNGQLKINYATKVLTGDTEPGFQIDLAHKDLSLVMTAANAGRVPMAIGAAARESLSAARAAGWGGKDFSALLDALCEAAGLEKVRFE
jgi:4-hydroxybutyrate dehydrogenase/sulfolactaldehyde 3-reductase